MPCMRKIVKNPGTDRCGCLNISSKDGDASTKDADQAATSQANPNPAVQTEKSTEEAYEEQADGLEQ